MLKVWGRTTSINVQKVMWVVAELEIPHEQVDVGGPFGGLDTAEYGALNPNRLVPVIEDDGLVVWESNAIVRYLAAKHGVGSIWPQDPAARARSDQWMAWQSSTLYPDLIPGVFISLVRVPPSQRDMGKVAEQVEKTNARLAMVDAHLAEMPFLAGDRLTMGDISVGLLLYRYYTLEIERPSLPNLEGYYQRLCDRHAYQEHVMMDYSAMRVTEG